jgi:hypothetical protein
MIEIKLKLSSGKEINLTAEEYEELRRMFEKKIYVLYNEQRNLNYPITLYPINPYPIITYSNNG